MKIRNIFLIIFSVFILTFITVNADMTKQPELMNEKYSSHDIKLVKKQTRKLDKQQIENVMSEFMDQLVQEVDDNYKVIKYNSITELKNSFSHLASPNVVDQFIDYYYYEEDDMLYIVPTETPPWFEPSNDYQLEKLNENHYRVIQTNNSDLHGEYTIVIDIKLNELNEPYIINITYQ